VVTTEAPGSTKLYRLYHYLNHPVKWVKIIGVVVAIDEFATRRVYTIDDASGACIECSCILPAPTPASIKLLPGVTSTSKTESSNTAAQPTKIEIKSAEPQSVTNPSIPYGIIDVGTTLKIKGRVGSFRDIIQIEAVNATVVKDMDVEIKFWDEALNFRKDVIGQRWVLSEEVVEEIRRMEEKRRRRDFKREKEKKKEARKEGKKDKDGGKAIRNEHPGATTQQDKGGGKERAKLLPKEVVKPTRKRNHEQSKDDRDAAKVVLEQEMKKRTATKDITNETRTKVAGDGIDAPTNEKKRRFKDFVSARQLPRYPSMAVRKAAAGKYDLLGI
jgi:hypothetical protein